MAAVPGRVALAEPASAERALAEPASAEVALTETDSGRMAPIFGQIFPLPLMKPSSDVIK